MRQQHPGPAASEDPAPAASEDTASAASEDPASAARSAGEIATRWASEDAGARYRTQRFGSARAAGRDPALLARLLRNRPLGPEPILDAPSGSGRLTSSLLQLQRPVVGLDISASMLTQLEGAPGVQGSAFALPLADRSCSLVVCCRLLHHLASGQERAALLAELARVTTRWVAISYWDAASWHALRRRRGWRRGGHDHRVPIRAAELRGLAEQAGLQLVERRFSMRFLSPQSWALLELREAAP